MDTWFKIYVTAMLTLTWLFTFLSWATHRC